jgi:hypothetical protein
MRKKLECGFYDLDITLIHTYVILFMRVPVNFLDESTGFVHLHNVSGPETAANQAIKSPNLGARKVEEVSEALAMKIAESLALPMTKLKRPVRLAPDRSVAILRCRHRNRPNTQPRTVFVLTDVFLRQ